jgi:hypothetical protein
MQRVEVVSESIKSIGYDEENKVLEVEFIRSGLYQYMLVPKDVHSDLMAAESKGKFVNKSIKPNYKAIKL